MLTNRRLSLLLALGLSAHAISGCSTAQKQTPASADLATQQAAAPKPPGKAETSDGAGTLSCTNGDETRKLEVLKHDEGCEFNYTKGGASKTVASSRSGLGHCRHVQAKLRKKLESAGYKCS